MKKTLTLFMILTVLSGLLTGCGGSNAPADRSAEIAETGQSSQRNGASDQSFEEDAENYENVDVDITEKMYVTYINEIYTNTEDYLGKNIRIQGMYTSYTDENTGNTYYYVYRAGPGCCGNDGAMCGFEFSYDGEMPQDNDWIEVTGTLHEYEEDGWFYLTLSAGTVNIMDERGAENVFQ